MKPIFYVRDYIQDGICDSKAISLCFADASKAEGEKTIVFDGKDFFIDEAIVIPSDTEIIVDNCMIKQNDLVYDNVFRGDNLIINGIDPYGVPIDVTPIHNIKIIGKGDARIVGTDKPRIGYHPFFNEYQEMTGDFWGWRTLMFSFSFAKSIEIAGLKLRQTMCWAICFDNCQECYVHDLDIRSNVKNGDGIDFRSGCNHCTVENITGFTEDDSVALTGLCGILEETFKVEGLPSDICRISIRNVATSALCANVRLLTQGDIKLHDITIDGVRDTSENSLHMDRGGCAVRLGDTNMYGTRHATKDEFFNITVKNVYARGKHAIVLAGEMDHLVMYGIDCAEGTKMLWDSRVK